MTPNAARRTSIAAGGLLLTAALAACGSSGPSVASGPAPSARSSPGALASGTPAGPTPPAAPAAAVTIDHFAYRVPSSVRPGATVTVTNNDQVAHTVTADQSGSLFDVTVDPGSTATFTAPDKPGSYKFHCKFHANMHGVLVVR